MEKEGGKTVLFACIGNSCRSQMAEGFARKFAGDSIGIKSAGTQPSKMTNPMAIEVMKEVGIDITDQFPKIITVDMLKGTTHFISMGCGVQESCPVPLFQKNIEDWDLEDPVGKDIDFFRKTRDIIRNKVEDLISRLN